MRHYDLGLFVVVCIVVACVVGGVASYYCLGPDNVIEEIAEDIIDGQTGWDVDLSPSTPERGPPTKKVEKWMRKLRNPDFVCKSHPRYPWC